MTKGQQASGNWERFKLKPWNLHKSAAGQVGGGQVGGGGGGDEIIEGRRIQAAAAHQVCVPAS